MNVSLAVRHVAGQPAYWFEDLAPGMSADYVRIVTQDDIDAFARLSGDVNPLHLDATYAAGTIFSGRIAHGALISSLISTVLGMRMPGPGCIYVSQSVRFKAPVRPGDEVATRATVKSLMPEKKRAIFETLCLVGGKVVIEGEAVVQVPSRLAKQFA